MAKKQNREEPEKRKPGRPQERVSLQPLEFEEALADLLATEPPRDDANGGAEKNRQK
jgi:hypothetical protein